MNSSALRLAILAALASAPAAVASDDLVPMGFYEVYHNGELVEITPNLVPKAARSYWLRAGIDGGAQISAWYGAPFSGAVSPNADTTAANFNSTLTEFTNYTETTRPEWVRNDEANQAIENTASLMTITIGVGGGTINGIALMSVATKGNAGGTLLAATRFAAARTVLEGDVLQFRYKLQLNGA